MILFRIVILYIIYMTNVHRKRRVTVLLVMATIPLYLLIAQLLAPTTPPSDPPVTSPIESDQPLAIDELAKIKVSDEKRPGYKRDEFGSGWSRWQQCDTRQKILLRDLTNTTVDEDACTVLSGQLADPYTGKTLDFVRGNGTSSLVQIDHVVALSNAWQTGAADWQRTARVALANDDLELLAVDGPANMQKSDQDASVWLPSNLAFRCQYVARQIAVKVKYLLWVSPAEHDAMATVLGTCPGQRAPAP
jgi:hypothetical protein